MLLFTRLLALGSQLGGAIYIFMYIHRQRLSGCCRRQLLRLCVCLRLLCCCLMLGSKQDVALSACVCLSVCLSVCLCVHTPGAMCGPLASVLLVQVVPQTTRRNGRQGGCAGRPLPAGLRQQHEGAACMWEPALHTPAAVWHVLWGRPALLATVVHSNQLASSQCWVIALGQVVRLEHRHCVGCSSS